MTLGEQQQCRVTRSHSHSDSKTTLTKGSAPRLITFSSNPSDSPVAWRSKGRVTVRQTSMLGSAAALVMPRSAMDKGCNTHSSFIVDLRSTVVWLGPVGAYLLGKQCNADQRLKEETYRAGAAAIMHKTTASCYNSRRISQRSTCRCQAASK